MRTILKESKINENVKAQVVIDPNPRICPQLHTMRNGYQWTGQPIDPELARQIIDALQEYLKTTHH